MTAAGGPPGRPVRLAVAVTDGRGRPIASAGLGPWLTANAPARARGRLTIALVSDATMRRLNRTFLGKDHPTDVLSFPADVDDPASLPLPIRAPAHQDLPLLGDLAIALGVARRQAHAQGHAASTELRVLALHGLLHLLGYDHEADQGRMQQTEERLRRRAGLPTGLIARTPGRRARR
jgi:probable rRNA maturation factor